MSRFEQSPEALARSLEWHARITTDLQRRVADAHQYVRTHSGDPQLMRILEGKEPA